MDVAPELAFAESYFGPAVSPGGAIRYPNAPTGSEAMPVTFDSVYTWHYGAERSDLRNLYEKSKDAMWNARSNLDWSIDVDPEAENMPNEMIPIFGSKLWDKLDKKTELPKLRRL